MATATKLVEANIQVYLAVQSAFDECSPEIKGVVKDMVSIYNDPTASDSEKTLAMHTIVDAIFPSQGVDFLQMERHMATTAEAVGTRERMESEEAHFADRVSQLMQQKGISQEELAAKMGVGQPAISNMLTRKCRPQQRSVKRAAEALGVRPTDLWPEYREK